MAEAYKGLVIRIGADTAKLEKALRSSDRAIKETQKQLRALERASRLDPTSMRVLNERLDQAGSRASTLARRFLALDDAARQLKSAGVGKLADQTRDAAYQAELARERYAGICDQIKRYKNELASAKGYDAAGDPFKGVSGYRESLKVMERMGASAEEVSRYSKLVAEYWARLAEKDIAEKVEQFKQLKVQMAANGAEARSLYSEMARLAAENPAATQTLSWRKCADELSRVGEAARSAAARVEMLDEAMRLDPTLVGTAEGKMAAMQERIRANVTQMRLLNSQLDRLRDAGADKTAASMANLAAKTEKVKARVAELQAELDGLRADKSLDAQGADAKRLASQLEKASALLNRMAEAGVYNGLSARMSLLSSQTTRLVSDLDGAFAANSRLRGSMQQLGWSMYSTVTPAFAMFAASAIQAAEDVDSAYRDMRKTVQGTDAQFEAMKQAALDFSRTHFTSADQLLEIEAIGGQLGVATSKLEEFATTVSNIEIATDLDAETASQQLGQLQGILNDMTQDDFARYGDALVRLGNNNATLESRIQDVMLRIASMGTITGFTTPQLLAWATAVASTGQGCEAAGTAISKTMSDIEAAVGGGGASLDAFAEVAGMTSSEFASAWNSDPSGAMYAFIQGLRDIEESGGSADNTLASLKITSVRQKQALLGLTQTIDGLNSGIAMSTDAWNGVSDEWGAAGDAAREADRKAEGFSGAIQILRNNFQALGAEVGESVVPVLRALTSAVAAMTQAYSNSPGAVKQLVNALVALAALMGPATVATSAFINAWKELQLLVKAKAAWSSAKKGAEAVNAALRALVAETVASTAANGANAASALAMSGAQKVAAAATRLLGTAMKALPWVAVAALAVEAVSAISDYAAKAETARKATDGMRESMGAFDAASAEGVASSLEDVSQTAQDAIQAQADLAEGLKESQAELGESAANLDAYAGSISRLAGKSGLTASEQAELKAAVAGVNEVCGTSYKVTDALNGVLSESTSAVLDNAEAWEANARARAAQEAYEDILAQNMELERELEKVNEQISETAEFFYDGIPMAVGASASSFNDLAGKARTLEESIEANNEAMDYYAGIAAEASEASGEYAGEASAAADASDGLADSLGEADDEFDSLVSDVQSVIDGFPALAQALSDGGWSAESFAAALSEAGIEVGDFEASIESYSETATNAFDEIGSASELSLDEMLENMRNNTEVTQSWADNITALYEQAGSDSEREFISYIASLGPQYADQVQALVDSAETYLPLFADAMGAGAGAGVDAALAQIGLLPESAGREIADAVTTVDGAMEPLPGDMGAKASEASSIFSKNLSDSKVLAKMNALTMAEAAKHMNENSGSFYRWGSESSYNFARGIGSNYNMVYSVASSIAGAVSRVLGHSVPKEGPLSVNGRGEAEWGRHLVQNFLAGMDSQEAALREKVDMIPNAVRDAVDRAQEYVSGGVSLQASVASGLAAGRARAAAAGTAATGDTYVVENITVQVREVSDVDPVKVVTEFAKRANRANGR